jgi:hypothetical protein
MNHHRFVRITACLVILLGGCVTSTYERQMQDVAKNWCMTIRASQIVPV